MSYAAAITAAPDSPTDDWAADHVRMLRELAELGMALARSVAAQALAQGAETEAGSARDPGLTFARIARTVRLTLALEARTREGAVARRTPAEANPELNGTADRVRKQFRNLLAPALRGARETEVRRVVEQALEHERPDVEDLHERISEEFDRMEQDDSGYDYLHASIGAIAAKICNDLGVEPDWTRWANQPWAVEEANSKAWGSPYAAAATFSPPPFYGGGGAARSAVTEGANRPTERPLSQPPDSG